MSNIIPITEQAAICFKMARGKLLEGARLLHQIREEKLYKLNFESFTAYLNEECQISDGFASKLIQIYEHYVLQGGVSQRKIEDVDSEKLYLAMKLKGSPEKQLVQALTLSRQELKSQTVYEKNGVECEHTPVTICTKCHVRL